MDEEKDYINNNALMLEHLTFLSAHFRDYKSNILTFIYSQVEELIMDEEKNKEDLKTIHPLLRQTNSAAGKILLDNIKKLEQENDWSGLGTLAKDAMERKVAVIKNMQEPFLEPIGVHTQQVLTFMELTINEQKEALQKIDTKRK